MFWNSTSDRCNMLQLSTEILYWSLVALTANTICVMHGAWTRRTTHANADLQLFDGWLWWESLEKADAKQSHTFERQQEMARRPEFAWCITHHHTRANQPIISPFEGHTHTHTHANAVENPPVAVSKVLTNIASTRGVGKRTDTICPHPIEMHAFCWGSLFEIRWRPF